MTPAQPDLRRSVLLALHPTRGASEGWLRSVLLGSVGDIPAPCLRSLLEDLEADGSARRDIRGLWCRLYASPLDPTAPLRLQILTVLSRKPTSSYDLGSMIGEPSGRIGSVMRHLRKDALVEPRGPRERQLWAITTAGRRELANPKRVPPDRTLVSELEVEQVVERVLDHLTAHGETASTALAEALGVPLPRVTAACRVLRASGQIVALQTRPYQWALYTAGGSAPPLSSAQRPAASEPPVGGGRPVTDVVASPPRQTRDSRGGLPRRDASLPLLMMMKGAK